MVVIIGAIVKYSNRLSFPLVNFKQILITLTFNTDDTIPKTFSSDLDMC